MPLPRFTRIAPEQREHILAVARGAFAADGATSASYNKIIAAAGISKTTAYQYFDGRDDLLKTVLDDLAARLALVLGSWTPATGAAQFWTELTAASQRLITHLADHPQDRVLAAHVPLESTTADQWLRALVTDGTRLGVIRTDIDPELLHAATASVLAAADQWILARWAATADRSPDTTAVLRLLAGLWATPTDKLPHTKGQ
ncbi:TetR/AcrR family transcriptional regulator [Nocardia sp. NBC_01503]|uniref:TetR/AcrR family transcriptional regulator n=1 Tax=Nocardia sp. NBC_01503 TaxID=2975997 RepID=UPI002E7B9AA6|nr:TetR/AcrR family transcriptional regulator [Nocardia sp. NBC_01503]WTL29250.1 TetR/AcrR family transcriptional regulator [Nocardia sp. NBC_01503]